MNVAMILAGGTGTRVGARVPKQFIKVCGKPIICYTLDNFEKHQAIDYIEIVCNSDYLAYMNKLCEEYKYNKIIKIVAGGKTYQDSVINGLKGLNGLCSGDDIVLTHMAASPIVSEEIISDSLKVCSVYNNAISKNDSVLCLGKVNGDYTDIGVDRENVVGLNTPQTVKYGLLVELYDKAEKMDILKKIDPHMTSLMFAMKQRMYFSKGSSLNFKITTMDDVKLFEAYVLANNLR